MGKTACISLQRALIFYSNYEKSHFKPVGNVHLVKWYLTSYNIFEHFKSAFIQSGMLLVRRVYNTYSLLSRPKGTWVISTGMEEVCIWFCVCVCVEHINSVGKPINLFMSVLGGLCDLSARES